jgi:hypothetical protein
MKQILLRVAADSNVEYAFLEKAIVRRVIFVGAARSTSTCAVEHTLRRGPFANPQLAMAHGDGDTLAMLMTCTAAAGDAKVLDIPMYEMVNAGDKWRVGCKLISGATAEQYTLALLHYETGID